MDDPLAATEPCAARLHDIEGALLLYYAKHKRLPADLDELRPLADFDRELSFTCPTSGKPYAYEPAGLRFPGKDERLVVYDADADHPGGVRWGILAAAPRGVRPAAAWVERLPEAIFQRYTSSPLPAR